MMKILDKFTRRIWLLLIFPTLAQAEPILNGIATHQELGKERFIAAVYSENMYNDPMALLASTEPRRMELKVTANRLSARRLNNMWIEGMAINNSATALEQHADYMVEFAGFVKKRLVSGDVLTIDGLPGEGARVSVNGVEVGAVESDSFFTMLLATWIGPVPLSSDFRTGLLTGGNVQPELLGRYRSITPSPERVDEIAAWSAPAPDPGTPPEAPPPEPKPAAAVAVATPAPAPAVVKPAVAAAAPTLAQAPTPAAPTPQPEAPAPRPAAPKPEPKPKPAPRPVAAPPADPLLDEDLLDEDELDEDGPALTAQSLLSRQLYHSKLKRWTYEYLKYPSRAQKRGQEGSVRLSVVIDRQGNVKTVSAVQESRYSLLNREALGAVKRATPFPPMPDEVQGNEFTFSLPIVFRLPD
ncbi:TonB family protein [Exilibacterium tricleocarpae]|nr:TonB family protein [Exilibacterium tricleocarpae]